ncbi:MAG: prepilin-type N-terminal cleavage/methylation domain-containing protein [Candidatus Blackburnbacteria bacterium]|nr:prepilin-type N-terminal cleavage/methylation domain-containing protein [Candidatus Blackburnbacteria bacterium]
MRIKLLHCYFELTRNKLFFIATLLNRYSWQLKRNQSNNLTIQQFNNSRLPRGVTLVELLIYMGILSIFLVVLTDMFASILELRRESEATSSVEQDGRYILSRMAYDIPRATDISTPPQIGQTRSNLKMTIGGFLYEYAESGGNLELSNDLGINYLNSSETTISNPTFQRIANTGVSGTKDTIKIQFTITSKTTRPGGAETKTFQTTIGRR